MSQVFWGEGFQKCYHLEGLKPPPRGKGREAELGEAGRGRGRRT